VVLELLSNQQNAKGEKRITFGLSMSYSMKSRFNDSLGRSCREGINLPNLREDHVNGLPFAQDSF
jgi:hypothetical protein